MKNITTATATLTAMETAKATIMVETATAPKMNKRNNPLYGRVCKHTAYVGVNFDNYAEQVNARREDEGKEATFEAKASAYVRINRYFVAKGEQTYMQFNLNKDCTTNAIWYVDNRPATAEEIATIKQFLPARKPSANQGLQVENQVQVRCVKVENVVAIGTETATYAV